MSRMLIVALAFMAACSKTEQKPPAAQAESPCRAELVAAQAWFAALLAERPPLLLAEQKISFVDPAIADEQLPSRAPNLVPYAGKPPEPFEGDYLAIYMTRVYYAPATPGVEPTWYALDPAREAAWSAELARIFGARTTRPVLLVAVDDHATWGNVKHAMAAAATSGYGATWFLFAKSDPVETPPPRAPGAATLPAELEAHCDPLVESGLVRNRIPVLAKRLTECDCDVDLDVLRASAFELVERKQPLSHVDIVLASSPSSNDQVQDASTMGPPTLAWTDAAKFVIERANAPVFFAPLPPL